MKKLATAFVLATASVALFTGCVPVNYTRGITVHKDASGNITGTDEFESVTEAHQEGQKLKEFNNGQTTLKYLK